MFAALALVLAQSIEWTRVDIDPKFRSEGVAVGDFNNDGKLDVANGEAWYEAPSWKPHALREGGMKEFEPATQYSRRFALWSHDVNEDDRPDLICIDFPGTPCYWLENPASSAGVWWRKHELDIDACNESPIFDDCVFDGHAPMDPWLVLASEKQHAIGFMNYSPPFRGGKSWKFWAGCSDPSGKSSARFSHGLGIGDVDGDGAPDVFTPHGAWILHPGFETCDWQLVEWQLRADAKSSPDETARIFAADLDGDRDIDLMASSAHGAGVWWYERAGTSAEPTFTRHTIDDTFSQSHALCYEDIDGDGERDLITGKRWYAHGPDGDVDAKAEPVVVWYQVKKGSKSAPKFTRHEIEVARGTGIGTQFQVIDVDGDQHADIVLSNKRGTHLLLQRAPDAKK